MKGLKDYKINTLLGVAIVALFSVIYLAISFYIVDSNLKKYNDYYYRFYTIRK